jgi:hypothetical protein
VALLISDFAFDVNSVGLYWYNYYGIQSSLDKNANVNVDGHIYPDNYWVEADDGSNFGELDFFGSGFVQDFNGAITSGTVNAVAEFDLNSSTLLWYADGLSMSASALYNAALTSSNQDDIGLIQAALAGDDTILLSPFNDRMSGYAGDDTISGGGGQDILAGGSGDDTFIDTAANLNGDTITDLQAGDRIVIRDANLSSSGSFANNVLTFGSASIVLSGVAPGTAFATRPAAEGGVEITIANRFGGGVLTYQQFGASAAAGGWTSDNHYPRELADVNGDGNADIVSFGEAGTYVALGNGDGTFAGATLIPAFGAGASAGGWASNDHYPRELADVNGDGRADIVAFGQNNVYVALSNGDGSFSAPIVASSQFTGSLGWSSNNHYAREVADVNGDGRVDLVGFGDAGTYVSLANPDGTFAAATLFTQFGAGASAGGWASQDQYPRLLADVNGDGRADVVAFGQNAVYVALGSGDGNFSSRVATTDFTAALGWSSNNLVPRELADVNGDHKVDIVGFGNNGVYVALGNGDGTFQSATLDVAQFGAGANAGGWSSEDMFPRHLADINHDGAADIVAFGSAGIYVAYANGDLF